MAYVAILYENINERDESESNSFEDLSEATKWASQKAEEKSESVSKSDGVEIMEGAPDFIAEYAILGTNSVVVLKEN